MARDSRQLKVSEALLAKAVLCIRDSSPFSGACGAGYCWRVAKRAAHQDGVLVARQVVVVGLLEAAVQAAAGQVQRAQPGRVCGLQEEVVDQAVVCGRAGCTQQYDRQATEVLQQEFSTTVAALSMCSHTQCRSVSGINCAGCTLPRLVFRARDK